MPLIGTAGWTIPAPYKNRFPAEGSQLARYSARLNGVEINSSFYRPHRHATYLRWAASVPTDFRFAVKVPRALTHEGKLKLTGDALEKFLGEVGGLGEKLAVLLVQLPPSLSYDADVAAAFFAALMQADAAIACEPRHVSWFTPAADAALNAQKVSRVAADPPRAPGDCTPGGAPSLAYYRLHGSPRLYYSDYSSAALAALAPKLRAEDWCIFDNTAGGCALGNALALNDAPDPATV